MRKEGLKAMNTARLHGMQQKNRTSATQSKPLRAKKLPVEWLIVKGRPPIAMAHA
jgi:hypothetical protein